MSLGHFVCSLLIAVVAGAGVLSTGLTGAAAADRSHAPGHTVGGGALPTLPTADLAATADGVRGKVAASGGTDNMAEDASCVAGHCAQCVAMPAALLPAIGDRQASDVAAAAQPYQSGRCTAPETPPRIA